MNTLNFGHNILDFVSRRWKVNNLLSMAYRVSCLTIAQIWLKLIYSAEVWYTRIRLYTHIYSICLSRYLQLSAEENLCCMIQPSAKIMAVNLKKIKSWIYKKAYTYVHVHVCREKSLLRYNSIFSELRLNLFKKNIFWVDQFKIFGKRKIQMIIKIS